MSSVSPVKAHLTVLLIPLFPVSVSSWAVGQDGDANLRDFFDSLAIQQQQVGDRVGEPISLSELEFLGETTPRSLLFELEHNELALYDLYNQLNSTDDFDIVCSRPPREGQSISDQVCEPIFLEWYRQENREEIAGGQMRETGTLSRIREAVFGPRELSDRELRERAAESMEMVQDEILSLAQSNPAFRSRLEIVSRLQRQYVELVREIAENSPSSRAQISEHARIAQTKSSNITFGATRNNAPFQ